MTSAEVVSHWSFTYGITVWVLAVVPNLPALVDSTSPTRRAWAVAWMAGGALIATFVDWESIVESNGWRLVVLVGLVALVGPVAARFLDATPRISLESPDVAGLHGPFTVDDLETADRVVGVVV